MIMSNGYILVLVLKREEKQRGDDGDFSFHQPKFSFSERDYRRLPKLPRFAYLISGTKRDGPSIRRLLQAVYHPRNYYVLHLDLEASDSEQLELAKYVKLEGVIREFGNVMVIGKVDLVTYKGPL
ncbi:Glycosyl transferase, family 14 [Corchorus olitorius]|uniref:Glycosyl transferase, family 14 n=1 Tax=Corchorus olitorius TaxID=93759 RepID=A0A1R3IW10_9ROSI|nr:Glycosyl transferase, family 14 [Corchorus olitorius]